MKKKTLILIPILITALVTGCGGVVTPIDEGFGSKPQSAPTSQSTVASEPEEDTSAPAATGKGSRDNTPKCLEPLADGTELYTNDVGFIDASHKGDGYVCVKYTGDSDNVKVLITPEGGSAYTYNLIGHEYETFPLTCGNGNYTIAIYTLVSGTSYATCLSQVVPVEITNAFGAFLYPNQYVKFNAGSQVVAKAKELVEPANSDLEAVTMVYDYVTGNITYDYDKASTVAGGYTSDVDEILRIGTGICLDYSAVMCSMLRSQGIPTHLEVGYAGEAYHAWISVFIEDVGWLNGIIEFDGKDWSLVDPTFAANSSESALKNFIGDGSNYTVMYVY